MADAVLVLGLLTLRSSDALAFSCNGTTDSDGESCLRFSLPSCADEALMLTEEQGRYVDSVFSVDDERWMEMTLSSLKEAEKQLVLHVWAGLGDAFLKAAAVAMEGKHHAFMAVDLCEKPLPYRFIKALCQRSSFDAMAVSCCERKYTAFEAKQLGNCVNAAGLEGQSRYLHLCLPGGMEKNVPEVLGSSFWNVQCVSFRGSDCVSDSARSLVRALQGRELQKLVLDNCDLMDFQMSSRGEFVVVALLDWSISIRTLSIRWNALANRVCAGMSRALADDGCRLEELLMDGNEIGEAGLQELMDGFVKARCLRVCSMEQNPFTVVSGWRCAEVLGQQGVRFIS